MTDAQSGLPLPGSRRSPLPGARRVGDVDPDEMVAVTVVLRRADVDGPASPSDAALVSRFAADSGIDVVAVDLAARSIRLRGRVATMNTAFGVALGTFETRDLTYRGRTGSVHIPVELADVVVAVLGLDSRPQAEPHFRYAPGFGPVRGPDLQTVPAVLNSMTAQQVAAAYNFPTGADGTGQTVAIIELGGGYRREDLDAYFTDAGLPLPIVETVEVDGATNSPGEDADAEVMLDIEVVGSVAPGARIAVYFGPNTTDGFYDAIAAAVHDPVRTPSVISISWGQAEPGWTAAALDAYEALFADAAALGISVYAAAGDNGATDAWTDGSFQVDFPSSAPSVLGCGGTRLGSDSEVVWNELASRQGATGGGYSAHFGVPAYQAGLPEFTGPTAATGRGVPDVAGNADPLTGYRVRVNGEDVVIGGTSAVSPLWAGLTLLLNELGSARLGAPHAAWYLRPVGFRDVVTGGNGGYEAGVGWDPCTGLGSPDGAALASRAPLT